MTRKPPQRCENCAYWRADAPGSERGVCLLSNEDPNAPAGWTSQAYWCKLWTPGRRTEVLWSTSSTSSTTSPGAASGVLCAQCRKPLVDGVCSNPKCEGAEPDGAPKSTQWSSSKNALGLASLASGVIAFLVPLLFGYLFAGAAVVLMVAARPFGTKKKQMNVPAGIGGLLGLVFFLLAASNWPF